jgi:hypothetical protein
MPLSIKDLRVVTSALVADQLLLPQLPSTKNSPEVVSLRKLHGMARRCEYEHVHAVAKAANGTLQDGLLTRWSDDQRGVNDSMQDDITIRCA